MVLTQENIKQKFPKIKSDKIKNILKYQETFGLTLDNLKCINPNCGEMKKVIDWKRQGLSLCCSKECSNIMSDEIKKIRIEKGKNTYLEKTGFENAAFNPEVQMKKKETNLKKYGVENIFQDKEYIDSKRLESTGYIHPSFDPNTLEKKRTNSLAKRGTTSYHNQHMLNMEFWNDIEFWKSEFITSDGFFDFKKAYNFFNCSEFTVRKQFYKFGTSIKVLGRTSIIEKEVREYITQRIQEPIIFNSRKIISPKELDIFIPAYNLAIEINGLYWHSYNKLESKNFHLNQSDINFMKYRHQHKIIDCMKKGIRLLHIYEDEDYISKIETFLNWEYDSNQLLFNLDSGCYPIISQFEISEPEEIIVLKSRTLWKAGWMKLNKEINNGIDSGKY
jgi:hypothetical protein